MLGSTTNGDPPGQPRHFPCLQPTTCDSYFVFARYSVSSSVEPESLFQIIKQHTYTRQKATTEYRLTALRSFSLVTSGWPPLASKSIERDSAASFMLSQSIQLRPTLCSQEAGRSHRHSDRFVSAIHKITLDTRHRPASRWQQSRGSCWNSSWEVGLLKAYPSSLFHEAHAKNTNSRPAHGRRSLPQRSTHHYRPQSLSLIPRRYLSARPIYQHQTRPGPMPQSPQRRAQSGIRSCISQRQGEVGVRVRLYARYAKVH